MRIAIACLLTVFPFLASALVEPKDKYICNCHITPGVSGGIVSSPAPATASKQAGDTPAPVRKKRKAASRPKQIVASGEPATASAPVKRRHKPIVRKKAVAKELAAPSSVTGDAYPGRDGILTTNKLVLPAGKSIYAPGELVYITGRVLDMKCVPVSDAIVEIWQTNPEGQYVQSTLGERLSPAPHFTGSGRATTDNLGRFNFVTSFPGAIGNRAPFIHVHVVHKDFPSLDTEMFFADDQRNATDPVFSSIPADQRSAVTAQIWQRDAADPAKGLAASWDISLNGKNPYRHF